MEVHSNTFCMNPLIFVIEIKFCRLSTHSSSDDLDVDSCTGLPPIQIYVLFGSFENHVSTKCRWAGSKPNYSIRTTLWCQKKESWLQMMMLLDFPLCCSCNLSTCESLDVSCGIPDTGPSNAVYGPRGFPWVFERWTSNNEGTPNLSWK